MSYQNDPIGAIQSDLVDIEKDLQELNEIYRAVNVLLATDRESVERNKMTVQEAAQMVANADFNRLIGAGFNEITLPEIATGLCETIDNVTDERDSFVNAQNELFAWNRGQTIKWICKQIIVAKEKIKSAENDHNIEQWTAAERELETLQACLEQLKDVKAKYVD